MDSDLDDDGSCTTGNGTGGGCGYADGLQLNNSE